ncbi:hypothetical protein AB0J86_24910 [Micromonospora sp. NPDC049559]|uniref:hypothetical protein n=1 Tax=Micromonospora sp. NPDC049559 TaxID=3155923 RepID=UPI00343568A8
MKSAFGRRSWLRPEPVLILLGLVGMAVVLPHHISGDGHSRYRELVELFDHGRLSNDSYSMVGPLFAWPFWAAGELAGSRQDWLAQFNLVLFALTLAVIYGLLRDRMDRALLWRFLLLLTAGSMVAAHVTDFYGEMFTAACVAVGVLVALVRSRAVTGWVLVVIGAVNTPASFVGLGLLSAERTISRRRLRYFGVGLAGVALIMGEAWLRRGGPFVTGHGGPTALPRTLLPYSGMAGFSYPFPLGVLAILLSFSKGLVFFVPGLLLPVRRRLAVLHDRDRVDLFRAYLLWLLFLAGLVVVYASWWAWYGGVYWGPRFFLIAVFPASLALAVAVTYRHAGPLADLATLALLGLSLWVGATSSVLHVVQPPFCADPVLERLCLHVPEISPLWYPLVDPPRLGAGEAAYLAYLAAVLAVLAAPVLRRLPGKLQPWLAATRPYRSRAAWRL